MVTIQPLSQMDPAWKDQKLGDDPSVTIGKFGCLLTCLTMVANSYGNKETPSTLNERMKNVGGFQGPLIMPALLPNALSNIAFKRYTQSRDYPAPINEIDSALARDFPVIVEVDYSPNPGLQNHWVVIYEKKGDDYLIRDPWPFPAEAKEVTLTSRYGFAGKPQNIITGAIWLEGKDIPPSPQAPPPQPKPIPASGYPVYASVDGLALRSQPFVADDNVIKRLPVRLKLYVVEDIPTSEGKIGTQGQWIKVQETGQGYEGYVAAWYVSKTIESIPPATPGSEQTPIPATPPSPSQAPAVVYAMVDQLAFRRQPNIYSGIIKQLPLNAQFASLEPAEQTSKKIGVANQWLKARDIEGDEGYVAAWYVSPFRQEALGANKKTSAGQVGAPSATPGKLVVRAGEEGLALRSTAQIQATNLIKRCPISTEFLVLEPVSQAVTKLGVVNQWLKVRDVLGQEGFVAAWYVYKRT